jgi:hypothetical protein
VWLGEGAVGEAVKEEGDDAMKRPTYRSRCNDRRPIDLRTTKCCDVSGERSGCAVDGCFGQWLGREIGRKMVGEIGGHSLAHVRDT